MAPVINSASNANWLSVYSASLAATPVMPRGHLPIPSFFAPVELDSHALLIGATSNQAEPTWRLAFWASQRIAVQGIGFAEVNSSFVALGLSLIRFPVLSDTYTLKIRVPRWHTQLSFQVWKYVGVTLDTNDLLGDTAIQLARIEAILVQPN